jgi:thiol-disulfide isomerase/thioredoxin
LLAASLLGGPGLLSAAGELSGRRAPGFALHDSNFKQHDPQDYRGRLLLVEIMKTDCPHCRIFSKILEEAKAKYGNRIAILTIVNPPDTMATVSRYIVETRTTIPILFDCGQVSASYLKITPKSTVVGVDVPHVFLIDGQGMIRNDFGYGPDTKEIFEGRALFAEIDRLLERKAAPAKK